MGSSWTSRSPVNLDGRRAFHHDALFQAVSAVAEGGRRHLVAMHAHGPLLPHEKVRPPHRGQPWHAVVPDESLAQGDSRLAIDGGYSAARREDAGAAPVAR